MAPFFGLNNIDRCSSIFAFQSATPPHPIISNSTNSVESMQFIQSILDCRCSAFDSDRLPTRVLDVDDLRIISTKDIPLPTRYFALSHCWGGQVPVQLIDESLPHTHKGRIIRQDEAFPFEALPRSFRDAVTMTRRMQTRYLWIDLLCIIQNSKEDWYTESRSMVRIYGRATCVLAADGAVNSEGGLFQERNPAAINTMYVKLPWLENVHTLISTSTWDYAVSKTFLGRRAWALQERMLGNIVIHFGEQLWTECQHRDCSETFPHGIPSSAKGLSSGKVREHVARLQDDLDENQKMALYQHWNNLIEHFSRTSLTHESDRLIVILGLCKFFTQLISKVEPIEDKQYIAGLWAQDFHPSCCGRSQKCSTHSSLVSKAALLSSKTARAVVDSLNERTHHHCHGHQSKDLSQCSGQSLESLVEIKPVAHDCYELEEEHWSYPGHLSLHVEGYLYFHKDRQQWFFGMHPRPMCAEDTEDAEGTWVGPPLALSSDKVCSEKVQWPEFARILQEAKAVFGDLSPTYQLMMSLARHFGGFKDRPTVVTKASPDFNVGDFTDMGRDCPRPVFGLPIMDTGDEPKFLNLTLSQIDLKNISGLLLHPDPQVPGQYRR